MPIKTFTDGQVLLASDVNEYLMRQAVIRCASVSERDAIPMPEPGMMAAVGSTIYAYTTAGWLEVASPPHTPPHVRGSLQRSDGTLKLNNGTTDLRLDPATLGGEPEGSASVWNGSGIHHPQAGLWWVYAALDTSVSGARWARVYPTQVAADAVSLGNVEGDDTASTGYGKANYSGFYYMPTGLAVRFRAYSNVGGSIRSSSLAGAVFIHS